VLAAVAVVVAGGVVGVVLARVEPGNSKEKTNDGWSRMPEVTI